MTSQKDVGRASVQSIVRRPWEFACQWYDVDDIHRCITQKLTPAFGGEIDIPNNVASREFAEWLADQYRLAMRKGAELAVQEMKDNNDDGASCPNCGEPSQMFTSDMDWCPKCKRQWYV